ncbi:MAG: hypothetical protein JWO48_3454 [Bryobacterales bacterium]|nr:hypothetical protein [Bryobacterales bacterium]
MTRISFFNFSVSIFRKKNKAHTSFLILSGTVMT